MLSNSSEILDNFKSLHQPVPSWLLITVLTFGLISNCLSIFGFRQDRLRKKSIFIYLRFLSFSQIFLPLIDLVEFVLIYTFNLSIYKHFPSQLLTYFIFTITDISNFMIIPVSIDRTLYLKWKNLSIKFCNPKIAYGIIITIVGTMLFLNSHILLFFRGENSLSTLTKMEKIYIKFFHEYFFWTDVFIYWILPLCITLICSFIMIKHLFLNKVENRNEKCVVVNRRIRDSYENSQKRITLIILMLNFLFYILVSPHVLIRIAQRFNVTSFIASKNAYAIACLFYHAYYTIQFLIYVFFYKKFKEPFKQLFR
ncbi:unnamed protein product [Brachionus calyciflorus]|uniref:G-protein coupled receptors family 1 profile domain-containing protein n=1 Tax=Brachionus calyciflorus TaxID=104777 RepID=A0A814ATS4_9BILA|nr:unnamed protein product [Brachionus calyciflorus]